jgi:hypothetical protein
VAWSSDDLSAGVSVAAGGHEASFAGGGQRARAVRLLTVVLPVIGSWWISCFSFFLLRAEASSSVSQVFASPSKSLIISL